MIDGVIKSTWLVVLCQKLIDALNLYGPHLLDKDIPITIVLVITILQNKQIHIMVYHNGFMKFKKNK